MYLLEDIAAWMPFRKHFTLSGIISFKIISLSSKISVSELHVRGLTYFIVMIQHKRIAPFMMK